MKIPSQTIWTKTNKGDVLGVLGDVSNVSLDTPGKITTTRKTVALESSANNADLAYLMSLVYFDGKYTAVTSNRIFQGSLDGTTWTEEVSFTPSTTNASDAIVFYDGSTYQLIVTTNSNFARWNGGGSINTSLGSLTADVPHPLAQFGVQLVIGNDNEVRLYNTSYVLQQTLTLPANHQVTTLRTRNNYIYIGTREQYGREASVFIWDGVSADFDYEVPVGAPWVFSMTQYRSSVACVTSNGQLLYINGTSTEELAAFPVYYKPHIRWQGAGGLQLNGKVFHRGMCTVGNTIVMNVEGDTDTGFLPEMRSGIWVYDPEVGLYHKANSSTDYLVRDGSLSVTNNVITTSAAHNLKTGDGVVFTGVSGLTGINTNQTYYVTVVSATTLKISNSRKSVEDERYVTIGGTAGASDVLAYFPNTDYGYSKATSGAILATAYNETPINLLSSEIIWGARTESPDGTATYVINCFSDQYNISRFETQRVYTDNITQNWKEAYMFVDGINYTNESVVLKSQTSENNALIETQGVWLDTTHINTYNTEFADVWGDIEIGDELVFISGIAQGRTAHVVDKTNSSTVYTLELDEAIGTAGSVSEFYVSSFKKEASLSNQEKDKEYIKGLLDSTNSSWVKIAGEVRGFQPSVNMIELSNDINRGSK